jgi:hypothetical protein
VLDSKPKRTKLTILLSTLWFFPEVMTMRYNNDEDDIQKTIFEHNYSRSTGRCLKCGDSVVLSQSDGKPVMSGPCVLPPVKPSVVLPQKPSKQSVLPPPSVVVVDSKYQVIRPSSVDIKTEMEKNLMHQRELYLQYQSLEGQLSHSLKCESGWTNDGPAQFQYKNGQMVLFWKLWSHASYGKYHGVVRGSFSSGLWRVQLHSKSDGSHPGSEQLDTVHSVHERDLYPLTHWTAPSLS